jgi:(5-formylfuran-3-yl)methyl phosphate synthase
MTGLLASVRSAVEAALAMAGGADIIDAKEPAAGALGRLPADVIRAIIAEVGGRRPVSATIGDQPTEPELVRHAVRDMAATGVDIVKVGLFPGDPAGTIAGLANLARRGVRIVAVFFADQTLDHAWIDRCADAGLLGVMVDTADKGRGSLTRILPGRELAIFVERARARHLLTGLAGSLRLADVPALLRLAPDYLGFRSALTRGSRESALDPESVRTIRSALDAGLPSRSATATAGAISAAAAARSPDAAIRLSKPR